MGTIARTLAMIALGVMLGGCVARVNETRLYGAAWPAPDAVARTITQRQAGIDGTAECRDVVVTAPMLREVQIRRSFADDAQEKDGVMAMLLGAGIGLIAYGQDKVQCPGHGGGCSDPTNAAYILLGLAAVPIGFLAYNAIAARDIHTLERVEPEARPGPWRSCAE